MPLDTDSVVDSPVNEVIDLKPDTKFFDTPGGRYFVSEKISVGRYQHYQRFEIQLGFSLRFSLLVDGLLSAYNALNERRDADAAVSIKQLLEGVTLIQERKPIAMYVATLFINKEGEDKSEWSEAMADKKMDDWKNINANFFLAAALSLVRKFPEKYNEIATLMASVGQVRQRVENLTED